MEISIGLKIFHFDGLQADILVDLGLLLGAERYLHSLSQTFLKLQLRFLGQVSGEKVAL